MKSLGEIYWDIDHECLHSDKTTSFSDETMILFHAAEEYVEELRKHDDRWKSIVLHDIDYLKASSFVRREQKGYSEGAEIFLGFIYQELERYGLKIDDGDNDSGGEDSLVNDFTEWKDVKDEIKALFLYPEKYKNFLRGCFLPNGDVKDIKGIVDSYNRNRVQNEKTIDKGVPTLLYKFLCKICIISVPKDKPDTKLRSFQRAIEKLKK